MFFSKCQHVYCSIREEIFLKIGGKSETKGDSDILFCSFNLIKINKCKYNNIFLSFMCSLEVQ